MLYKDIPIELRNSVLSYLESMIEYKRMYKLNEKEVLDMLNNDLRDQVLIYINGKILQNSHAFQNFNLIFLSFICFELVSTTFAGDDIIFEEGASGDKLYFITKGDAIIIHK